MDMPSHTQLLNALQGVRRIITHDNCHDGIASALILTQALPGAEVLFVQYGTRLHQEMEARAGDLFCDFTPHPSRVEDFLKVRAMVFDHHGGPSKAVTERFAAEGLGVFADEKVDLGVSGATLAYQEVYTKLHPEGEPVLDRLGALIGVRDTWQTKDPRWQAACALSAAIMFWPWTTIRDTPVSATRAGPLFNNHAGIDEVHTQGRRLGRSRAVRGLSGKREQRPCEFG
jgi:hypothetical protein